MVRSKGEGNAAGRKREEERVERGVERVMIEGG